MVIQRWSDGLIELTRDLLKNDDRGIWPMKHTTGSFGLLLTGGVGGGFLLATRATGVVLVFASFDSLIEDGWAVD
ncbi:hypothetical protein AWB72_05158 [Caballeronia concitans]|uniref:Uncharacterized protein n=1 Tax=Caballeronia concitans TaxID=1777133 RepID=A0A658R478_9BURK|nr:hypothetical protein AWB72_05158 [Caballeronia concitans]